MADVITFLHAGRRCIVYAPRAWGGKNRFCAIRVHLAGRKWYEKTLKGESDPDGARRTAERFAEGLPTVLAEPEPAPVVERPANPETFAQLAELYLSAEVRGTQTRKNVKALVTKLGDQRLKDLQPGRLDEAIRAGLGRGRKPQTINRHVVVPFNAVLHFGRKRFQLQVAPAERRKAEGRKRLPAAVADIRKLVAAAAADKPDKYHRCPADFRYRWLLLLILHRQGWRISETLQLTWDRVRVDEGVFYLWVGKVRKEKQVPMHRQVREALAAWPEGERARCLRERRGRVFPWLHRGNVRRWLKPFRESLGLTITPHQFRHRFATDLNRGGASLLDIREAGSWTDIEAIENYVEVDINRAREVIDRLGYGETPES